MKIPNQPIGGAEPLMCTENVRKRIKACGGRAVYGWIVKDQGEFLAKSAHCVWQNDQGELFDVTPYFVDAVGPLGILGWPETIEFDPDPNANGMGVAAPFPAGMSPSIPSGLKPFG